MIDFPADIVWPLLRASAALAVASVIVTVIFRFAQPSVRFARLVWLGVILQGLVLARIDVPVPRVFAVLGTTQRPTTGERVASDVALNELIATSERSDVSMESTVAVEQSRDYLVLAGRVWILGAVFFLATMGVSYVMFVARLSGPLPAEAEWAAEFESIRQLAVLRRPVRLHPAAGAGPAVCRVLSGDLLVVPADEWRQLSGEQRRTVIRHELAHLERGDLWKTLAFRLLALPHWFNPLAWWAVRQFDDCAEWACDEITCRSLPDSTAAYARALLKLGHRLPATPAVVPAATGRGLVRRIRNLVKPSVTEDSKMKKSVLIAVVAVVTVANSVHWDVAAQETRIGADPVRVASSTTNSDNTSAGLPEVVNNEAEQVEELVIGTRVTTGHTEAVVDVALIFKELPEFQRRRDEIKKAVTKADAKMRKSIERMKELQQAVKDLDLLDENYQIMSTSLQEQMVRLKTEIDVSRAQSKQDLMRLESQAYLHVFRKIQSEIADYARANGIHVVRRAKLVTKALDEIDESNPQAVIQAINNDLLYVNDQVRDITGEILKRLKAAESKDVSKKNEA